MIKLWFSALPDPELLRVQFVCPVTGRKIVSVRGRGVWGVDGSFPWTAGVRALSVLFVKIFLNDSHTTLTGNKGSLAASLDFAIGKPPAWLKEMFGVLPGGIPIITKLFDRLNPEGKRHGPFEVAGSTHYLAPEKIEILVDGAKATPESATALLSHLINEESQDIYSFLSRPDFLKVADAHTARSFTSIDIFSSTGRSSMLARIYAHPGYKKYAPKGAKVTHPIDDALMARDRLGICDPEVRSILATRKAPIRFASNMPTIPVTILFKYLQRLYDIPLEIDINHLHAAEVGKRILADDFSVPPDLCVLGLGPTTAILSQKDKAQYVPLTPLPSSYDELISGVTPPKARSSRFSFIDDFPSTPRLFYERLQAFGNVSEKSSPVQHFEPADSIAATLDDTDSRTILFFPYNVVAKLHYGLREDKSMDLSGNITDMILFGHRSFVSDSRFLRAFLTAMRDAWLRLRSDESLQRSLRDELLRTEEYQRIFCRAVELPFKMVA